MYEVKIQIKRCRNNNFEDIVQKHTDKQMHNRLENVLCLYCMIWYRNAHSEENPSLFQYLHQLHFFCSKPMFLSDRNMIWCFHYINWVTKSLQRIAMPKDLFHKNMILCSHCMDWTTKSLKEQLSKSFLISSLASPLLFETNVLI